MKKYIGLNGLTIKARNNHYGTLEYLIGVNTPRRDLEEAIKVALREAQIINHLSRDQVSRGFDPIPKE